MRIQVEIINFRKYQGRPDIKKPQWFKLENNIIISESLDNLTPAEKWFFVFLISRAQDNASNEVDFCGNWASKYSGLKLSEIKSALKKLEQNQVIRFLTNGSERIRSDPSEVASEGSIPFSSLQFNKGGCGGGENAVKLRQSDEQCEEEFNKIWALYPRKIDKKDSLRVFKAKIHKPRKWVDFRSAVEHYSAYVEKEKTEPRFIKYMSSFINSGRWEDYINGPPEEIQHKSETDKWLEKYKGEEPNA